MAVQSGQRGVPLRVVERETEAMLGATAHAANMTRVWPGATTRLRERAAGEVRARCGGDAKSSLGVTLLNNWGQFYPPKPTARASSL